MNNEHIYDRLTFWGTCIAYTGALLFIYLCYSNKLGHSKYINKNILSSVYPARFNFYTRRTVKDQVYRLYTIKNGKATYCDIRPFTSGFLYGLNRDSKIIAVETSAIAQDSLFNSTASRYEIKKTDTADINNYISADTLKYNDYHSGNIHYLNGRFLVTIESPDTWQQKRANPNPVKTITIIPVVITTGR